MTEQQNSNRSEALSEGAEIDSVVQRVRKLGSQVEKTELPGGTSVDFGLFKRHRYEKALERGGGGSIGDAVERGALPESVADFGQRKLDSAGSQKDAKNVESNDLDVATQKTGGLCKSSIIISDGAVVEYNLRLPPVATDEYLQTSVESQLSSVCRNSQVNVLDGASVVEHVFVRREFPDEVRDDVTEYIQSQGYSVPDEWYPHVRSLDCSVPVFGFLDFTNSLLDRYDRRFPDARKWATPDAGWPDQEGKKDPFDILEESVADFESTSLEEGAAISFQFPAADRQSTIDSENGEVVSYELALPPHDPGEYGKILLEKAVEHVVETRGVFLGSDQRLDAGGEVYRPYIENPDCSEPLSTIARDVTTLIEAYDTIHDRSRLS